MAELQIGGFTRLSTCDWPGQLAATVFCQGCGWDCAYCHNPHLRPGRSPEPIAWDSVLKLLERRRGLLDGVVFSGGEPTLQAGLRDAILAVSSLGFRVALHTGGMYPDRFAEVLPLIDWVGLDFKAPLTAYARITGVEKSGQAAEESLRLLLASGVSYEVRTTFHPALLSPTELQTIREELLSYGVRRFVIQRFQPRGVRSGLLPPPPRDHQFQIPAEFGEGFERFEVR